MSEYRDDSHDIAVASDFTWAGISSVTEDLAKIEDANLFTLRVLHTDTAAATDAPLGGSVLMTAETAHASSIALGMLRAQRMHVEHAQIADRVISRTVAVMTEEAQAADTIIDAWRSVIHEAAGATDAVLATRHVASFVAEQARVADLVLHPFAVLIEDEAGITASVLTRMRRRDMLDDGATVEDQVQDGRQASTAVLAEQAHIEALALGRLLAADLIADGAVAEGFGLSGGSAVGQAWTANTETWAMSRYAPYTFHDLAVVDGVLYGLAEDGVYELGNGAGLVDAQLRTGKLDIGQGALAHPTAAFLEYSLTGDDKSAHMDVTTTQTGAAQTYTYSLAREQADELTNGRFIFGRGLRGRHFSFTLRLSGTGAHINDLRIESAPTKRRT